MRIINFSLNKSSSQFISEKNNTILKIQYVNIKKFEKDIVFSTIIQYIFYMMKYMKRRFENYEWNMTLNAHWSTNTT